MIIDSRMTCKFSASELCSITFVKCFMITNFNKLNFCRHFKLSNALHTEKQERDRMR